MTRLTTNTNFCIVREYTAVHNTIYHTQLDTLKTRMFLSHVHFNNFAKISITTVLEHHTRQAFSISITQLKFNSQIATTGQQVQHRIFQRQAEKFGNLKPRCVAVLLQVLC